MHVEQSRPPLIPVSKNNIAHLTSRDMLIRRDNHIYYFNVHYLILNNKMKYVVVNVQIITICHKHSSVSPTIYTLNNTSPHGATPHDR